MCEDGSCAVDLYLTNARKGSQIGVQSSLEWFLEYMHNKKLKRQLPPPPHSLHNLSQPLNTDFMFPTGPSSSPRLSAALLTLEFLDNNTPSADNASTSLCDANGCPANFVIATRTRRVLPDGDGGRKRASLIPVPWPDSHAPCDKRTKYC